MRTERSPSRTTNSPLKPIVISSLIGAIAMSLVLAGISLLFTIRDIPHAAVEPLALLASGFGCIIAGFLCAKINGKNGLIMGSACGLLIFGIIILAGYIAVDGQLNFAVLIKAVIFILCGAIGGVLGVNTHPAVK